MPTLEEQACPAASCAALTGPLDRLLDREWLLTNGLGGYASGTVIGCATRRYHGLLVASQRPPLERVVLLANTLDQVVVDGETYETPTFAFRDAMHPTGHVWLTHFDFSLDPGSPWAEFMFDFGRAKLRKRITLANGHNVVRISYEVMADSRCEVRLNVMPLLAGRDFSRLGAVSVGGSMGSLRRRGLGVGEGSPRAGDHGGVAGASC